MTRSTRKPACPALAGAIAVVTHDPLFGLVACGGQVTQRDGAYPVHGRDGAYCTVLTVAGLSAGHHAEPGGVVEARRFVLPVVAGAGRDIATAPTAALHGTTLCPAESFA